MRLIDADELIQEIREDNEGYYFNSSAEREVNFAKADYAINRIREAPAVEAKPHGKWEEPFEHKGKMYHECTHCHISTQLILVDNFCPYCGADMRGDT